MTAVDRPRKRDVELYAEIDNVHAGACAEAEGRVFAAHPQLAPGSEEFYGEVLSLAKGMMDRRA